MIYPVSQRFIDTIPYPHRLITTCTITPYGAGSTTVRVAAGSITVDRSQRIRRTGTLILEGGTNLYALLSSPGTRIAVDHGFAWSGTDQELVPQIRAELTSAALPLGAGTIQIGLADYWQRLAAADFDSTYTPDVNASRVNEIIAAVQGVFPDVQIVNSATDTGPVATSQAWTSRADMINAFATDGGMEAYFGADGAFVIRDVPKITDNVSYLIKTGVGGTLGSMTRTRPLDKLYNSASVVPGTSDPGQTWVKVTASITDPNDPRHPDRIGPRPYPVYAAPTLLTESDAASVAEQILTKVTGTTETLTLEALAHPGLEPGDVVRAQTPLDGGSDIVNNFLEQFTIDFATGAMSANTRNNTEFTA